MRVSGCGALRPWFACVLTVYGAGVHAWFVVMSESWMVRVRICPPGGAPTLDCRAFCVYVYVARLVSRVAVMLVGKCAHDPYGARVCFAENAHHSAIHESRVDKVK